MLQSHCGFIWKMFAYLFLIVCSTCFSTQHMCCCCCIWKFLNEKWAKKCKFVHLGLIYWLLLQDKYHLLQTLFLRTYCACISGEVKQKVMDKNAVKYKKRNKLWLLVGDWSDEFHLMQSKQNHLLEIGDGDLFSIDLDFFFFLKASSLPAWTWARYGTFIVYILR